MRNLATIVAVFLAMLVTGGCITDPVTGRTVIGAPVSDAEEQQMGLSYRPQIVQEYDGAYPDARLQDHMGRIVLGMAKQSVRPDLPWTFTVLNTSVPNAFAVPGGQVFVTRGLLVQMEDEAEYAVVMGHELGHVEHRHSIQQQGWGLITQGVLAGIDAKFGGDASQVGGVLAGLGMLSFSRADETEADVRGVENSYAAGYDPRQGADVFRIFLKMKQDAGDGTPTWLSSHPADEERIQNVLQMSAQKDPRLAGTGEVPGLRVTTPAWAPLIANLRREQKTYDRYDAAMKRISEAQGSDAAVRAAIPDLLQCERELPGHALFSATAGKALLTVGDTAAGRTRLERASGMNQGLVEPEILLGELALDANDWNRANTYAERGLQALPGNYASLYVRGEANWNLGRQDAARQDLQAVLEGAPKDSRQYQAAATRIGAPAAAAAADVPAKPKATKPKAAAKPKATQKIKPR
ncbi:MAG: M48 family metalloprotease [Planctomycetes bacterium]|nr:M48 family metalloprotease [Planctomycetota bacterium]